MNDGRPEPDDDPFAQLLDPEFASGAVVRELSAEERLRAAQRSVRSGELQIRLADEQAQQRSIQRRSKRRKWLRRGALMVLVSLVASWAIRYQSNVERSGTSIAQTTSRPVNFPPVDTSASKTPLGVPPPAPSGDGEYSFMRTQPDSADPVAWDPCRPVRYVVNWDGAPAGAQELVDAAVKRVSVATGLVFQYDSTTDETWSNDREPFQPDRYGKKWAPALIAWSTDKQVPGLGGYIAGLGGPAPVSSQSGQFVSVSGKVVLDIEAFNSMLASPGGEARARAVVQHELGHLVGLDHVADPHQVMFSGGSSDPPTEWGSGDLAGLHALGKGDCFPDV